MAISPSTSLTLPLDIIFSSHCLSPSSQTIFSSCQPFFSIQKFHHLVPIKSLRSSSSHSLPPPLHAPPRPNNFLDPISLHRLRSLESFHYTHEFNHGSLQIRTMDPNDIEPTVYLLAESFEIPASYVKYRVMKRMSLVPHSVIIVGLYKGKKNEGSEERPQLACTAEVSFDAIGFPASLMTPLAPRNCPYICNLTVKKMFRRRGIGRQLLKACEELISQMKTIRKVYLHCRVIDTIPFQMYKKAGYSIVQTDSFLVWLTIQRRKYLMCKELPPLVDFQQDDSDSEVIHSDKFKDQRPEAAG